MLARCTVSSEGCGFNETGPRSDTLFGHRPNVTEVYLIAAVSFFIGHGNIYWQYCRLIATGLLAVDVRLRYFVVVVKLQGAATEGLRSRTLPTPAIVVMITTITTMMIIMIIMIMMMKKMKSGGRALFIATRHAHTLHTYEW